MKSANENHSIEARHLATMLAARSLRSALESIVKTVMEAEPATFIATPWMMKMKQRQLDAAIAAIAQAEAAGIDAPAHVIAASSDLAKGDAP